MSTMRVDNILSSGGGNNATINGITPAFASQAEAEAGTDNTKIMTPLRVAQAARPILGTAQTPTSGTFVDFTGIPATATRVSVILTGVSFNAAVDLRFQLGDSDGIETTGYAGSFVNAGGGGANSSSFTSGFDAANVFVNTAAAIIHGRITFTKVTGNTWVADGVLAGSIPTNGIIAGSKTLSATLDRVRVTTVAGTATFDAGSINIMWE